MNTTPNDVETNRPRTGTIVWGVIFMVVCAGVTQQVLFPGSVAPEVWITGIALLVGAVFLTLGIVVVMRDRKKH